MSETPSYSLGLLLLLFFLCSKGYAQLTLKDITFDSTRVTFKAGKYNASPFKRFFFGNDNRSSWDADVTAPVFNIQKAGLKAVKQGGSRQTLNIRLVDTISGYEYVLRSIDKTGNRALPAKFHGTFIADIFQDQTAADNPYGAFTIPPMSKAIGIYYTTPYLVYVPHDPSFGKFTDVLANKPALFEMRADSNMSKISNFGNPIDIKSTDKLIEKLQENHKNKVDEHFYLRSRLFDMMIGDWGRHEDQWRWGKFEMGNNTIYRPIPRDRDHAYFRINGIFPHLATRPWSLRNLSDFRDCYQDIIGLGISAASLDRRILVSSSEAEWVKQATYIQSQLTDSLIENAIGQLPPNAYKAVGGEIISKLKSRRDQLVQAAKIYYKILAREINIIGSDKKEFFNVDRINSDSTLVEVHALNKKDEKEELLYKRYIKASETREINLYGMGGDDVFNINGKAERGIQVRITGGEGEDIINDYSQIAKGRKKTLVYDTKSGTTITKGPDTKNLLSNKAKDSVNLGYQGYHYNYIGPTFYPGFNPDDGIFLGLGLVKKTYETRKRPYKNLQRFGINYAFATGAFNFRYYGDFRTIYKRWHVAIDARLYGPQYVLNYFGYGNNSKNTEDINFYRTRGIKVILNPSVYKELSKHVNLGLGPDYNYYKLDSTIGRYVATPGATIDPNVFNANHFLGARIYLRINNADSTHYFVTNGYKLTATVTPYTQLNGNKKYVNTAANISFFKTFSKFKAATFALRVGGASNFGEYFFYQAPNIGGTTNLRGYRRSRFFGNQSMYSNNEVRLKLINFRNYVFKANFGLIGFFDIGRVWSDQKSKTWHRGYGPGFWFEFYEQAIISGTFGFSDEGTNIFINYGFFF